MALGEVHTAQFSFQGSSLVVGTELIFVMAAPTDAQGGGITVVGAGACSPTVIAVGSCPNFNLYTYSSAYAISGTIGSQTLGTSAWTAGTPKLWTISDGWVDGAEYIVVKVSGTVANADTIRVHGWVNYIVGK